MEKIKALLLMGGSGRRFDSELPKQFHRIAGKKIYLHTLEKCIASKLFDEILLICHAEWMEEVRRDIAGYTEVGIRVVQGGATRQESSYLGLLACGEDTATVVIHDAVRPFVSERILRENVRLAIQHHAVDTCIPSADTIVHSQSGDFIDEIPQRSAYLRGQTPQSFSYPLILKAHRAALEKNLNNTSDDCKLVLSMGHKIHILEGDEQNIKITSPLDLFLAEQLFRTQQPFFAPAYSKEQTPLHGQRFVITGGTGGIGEAIAKRLTEESAIPIVVSRSAAEYPLDWTSFEAVQRTFDQIYKEHGLVDGLINSAGLFKLKTLSALSAEEIQELIAVNFTGLAFSCRSAKIKPGGHIVNIASSSYSRGRKDFSIYSAAKAAVVNFTQALAEERSDLKVNAVVPQRTRTAMRSPYFPDESIASLLEPEEVADAIVNLLKEEETTGIIMEVRKKN